MQFYSASLPIQFLASVIKIFTLPTSNPGVTGQLWNSSGTVRIA